MNSGLGTVLLTAALWPLGCSGAPASTSTDWALVWSDEFDRDGSPDPQKWTLAVGGNGWGNQELQYYTARFPDNVAVQNGHLTIRARRESYTGSDGVTRMYTSGRLHTQHRFSARYGRVEARIKLPVGTGLWPAFWMLHAVSAGAEDEIVPMRVLQDLGVGRGRSTDDRPVRASSTPESSSTPCGDPHRPPPVHA